MSPCSYSLSTVRGAWWEFCDNSRCCLDHYYCRKAVFFVWGENYCSKASFFSGLGEKLLQESKFSSCVLLHSWNNFTRNPTATPRPSIEGKANPLAFDEPTAIAMSQCRRNISRMRASSRFEKFNNCVHRIRSDVCDSRPLKFVLYVAVVFSVWSISFLIVLACVNSALLHNAL